MKKSMLIMGMALVAASSLTMADSLYVDATGNVGVGVDSTNPATEKFHVMDGNFKVEQTGAAVGAQLVFTTAGGSWDILQNGTTGRLAFRQTGTSIVPFKMDTQAQNNLLQVGINGADQVDINGRLIISGTEVVPDYVFDENYELESIENHAKFMFENKHLPAVSKAPADMKAHNIDILAEQMAVLEELEKAHIYISQLNSTIKEMQADVAELKKSK